MNDQLLKDLGNLARQQDDADRSRLDERWDRLAAGTLTAEEDAELRALAEASPEGRETYEAFRPLGNDFQARVVSAINEERGEKGRVLPFRRIEVWVGAAAAVAASLFLVVRITAPLPLPAYQAQMIGGDQEVRGTERSPAGGTPVFTPGSLVKVALHPQPPQSVQGHLEALTFLIPAGGAWSQRRPVTGFAVEPGESGEVLLSGTLGETIQLPLGTWQICAVVSRPGKAPAEGDLQHALGARHDAWQMACAGPMRVEAQIPP